MCYPAAADVRIHSVLYGLDRHSPDVAHEGRTAYLDQILDSALDLILIIDCNARVMYANARLKEMTGYELSDILGRFVLRFVPRDWWPAVKQYWQGVKAGHSQTFECEYRQTDGTQVACLVSVSPIIKSENFLVVVREVSKEKALQARLIQIEKSAALGRLAAGAAHELNNPLTAVLGFAQILREEAQDPQVQEDLDRIIRGALRARRIVQYLLAFARQQTPVRSEVDVNKTINESIEDRMEQIEQARIEIIRDFEEPLPSLLADFRQLKVVWDNLINNACQAMAPQGGGELIIQTEHLQDVIRVIVTDTGPGIPASNLSRIFDPFFTTKEVGQGVGLGLSLCHGIVETHGGQIWAESTEGEGASFIVELPFQENHEGLTRKGT